MGRGYRTVMGCRTTHTVAKHGRHHERAVWIQQAFAYRYIASDLIIVSLRKLSAKARHPGPVTCTYILRPNGSKDFCDFRLSLSRTRPRLLVR